MATRFVRRFARRGVVLPLLGALLAPVGVEGQETLVPIQFSYSDPGARSMGFGGAFVALADDATAAFANPAGLVQLVRPEVSIEARRSSYSTPFTESGRVEGLPSGFGIDDTAGLRSARSEDTLTGLSFLSVAYPGEGWSLAFFRHELANFEFSGATQGLFGGGSQCCQTRLYDQRVRSELGIVSFGISGAVRVNDRFVLGLGASYHEASLSSRADVFRFDDDTTASVFARSSYLPERLWVTQTLFGEGNDWSLLGGFLWKLGKGWSIGGVFRQGSEFELAVETTAGPAFDPDVPPGEVLARFTGFAVEWPWVLGLGASYREPDGGLTVTFQWDRVNYSSIVDSLPVEDEAIDDVDELHLGAEYVFLRSTPLVALRIGVWLDPDHQIRATGDDPFKRALQPRGDDDWHTTAGVGVALQSFQIDLGADFADRVDTFSVSAVFSF